MASQQARRISFVACSAIAVVLGALFIFSAHLVASALTAFAQPGRNRVGAEYPDMS